MPRLLPAGRATIKAYQTPRTGDDDDPARALVDLFGKARTSILFAIYSLTLPDVADALLLAHGRGVDVRGVADATSAGVSTSQVPGLQQAGVPVRLRGSRWALMHLKVAVVDHRWVALGSFNWTTQAERSNDEVLVVMSGSAELVAILEAQIGALT